MNLKNIVQSTSIILALSLTVTACDKTKEVENTETSTIEDKSLEKEEKNEKEAGNLETETTSTDTSSSASEQLATTMVKMAKVSMESLSTNPMLSDEQKKCIGVIEYTKTIPEVTEALDKSFSKEELEKILTFFADKDIKGVFDYSMQVIKDGSVAPTLSNEEMMEMQVKATKKLEDFNKTELGQKLSQFQGLNSDEDKNIEKKLLDCMQK